MQKCCYNHNQWKILKKRIRLWNALRFNLRASIFQKFLGGGEPPPPPHTHNPTTHHFTPFTKILKETPSLFQYFLSIYYVPYFSWKFLVYLFMICYSVIISFSSTTHIPLGLLHGKPLFTVSEDHVMRQLRVTVENYPQASIFDYFALIKVIEHEGTFVGKRSEKDDLNEVCASMI